MGIYSMFIDVLAMLPTWERTCTYKERMLSTRGAGGEGHILCPPGLQESRTQQRLLPRYKVPHFPSTPKT